ncbi:hypothetical protein JST56_05575 [Candidatus Dependentiae bacterium]|nr:hypothetical protein [Candidatus Dependentiae bacterium]
MKIFSVLLNLGIIFLGINACFAMQDNSLEAQIAQYRAKHAQVVRCVEQSEGTQVAQSDNNKNNKIRRKILSNNCDVLILRLSAPELSSNKEQIKKIVESEVADIKYEIKREKKSGRPCKKTLKRLENNKRKLESFIGDQDLDDDQDLEFLNRSLKKCKFDDETEQLDDDMVDG